MCMGGEAAAFGLYGLFFLIAWLASLRKGRAAAGVSKLQLWKWAGSQFGWCGPVSVRLSAHTNMLLKAGSETNMHAFLFGSPFFDYCCRKWRPCLDVPDWCISSNLNTPPGVSVILHDNRITFIQLINVCLTTFIQFLSPAHKREPDINFSFKTIDLATADLLFCHSEDWLDIVGLFHSAVIKHKINYASNLLFLWTKD